LLEVFFFFDVVELALVELLSHDLELVLIGFQELLGLQGTRLGHHVEGVQGLVRSLLIWVIKWRFQTSLKLLLTLHGIQCHAQGVLSGVFDWHSLALELSVVVVWQLEAKLVLSTFLKRWEGQVLLLSRQLIELLLLLRERVVLGRHHVGELLVSSHFIEPGVLELLLELLERRVLSGRERDAMHDVHLVVLGKELGIQRLLVLVEVLLLVGLLLRSSGHELLLLLLELACRWEVSGVEALSLFVEVLDVLENIGLTWQDWSFLELLVRSPIVV
jgi:hypothetical protein